MIFHVQFSFKLIIIQLLILCLASCNIDRDFLERDYPLLVLSSPTITQYDSVKLSCSIKNKYHNPLNDYGFIIITPQNDTLKYSCLKVGVLFPDYFEVSIIDNLKADFYHKVYAYAKNNSNIIQTEIQTFKPIITTEFSVNDYFPKSPFLGEPIKLLLGSGGYILTKMKVRFGPKIAEKIEIRLDTLLAYPAANTSLNDSILTIENNLTGISKQISLNYKKPTISQVEYNSQIAGDYIKIYGKYDMFHQEKINVFINNEKCNISFPSDSVLIVQLPLTIRRRNIEILAKLKVYLGIDELYENSLVFRKYTGFEIIAFLNVWGNVEPMGVFVNSSACFTIFDNTLYKYNYSSKLWTNNSNPVFFNVNANSINYLHNNNLFLLGGKFKSLETTNSWSYSFSTGKYENITDIPFTFSHCIFEHINNELLIVVTNYNETWLINKESFTFTKLQNFPGNGTILHSFKHNNNIFIIDKNAIWKLNSANYTWDKIGEHPFLLDNKYKNYNIGFTHKKLGHLFYNTFIYKYSETDNNWICVSCFPGQYSANGYFFTLFDNTFLLRESGQTYIYDGY